MRIRKLFVYNYSFEREHVSTNWIKQKKKSIKKTIQKYLGCKSKYRILQENVLSKRKIWSIEWNKRKEEYLLTEYPRPAVSIAWCVNVATVKICGLTEHSAISLIWHRASAMTKRPSASVFPIRTLVPDFAVITSSETYEFSPTLFLTTQRAATAFTVGGCSKFTTWERKIHKMT